MRVEHEADPLPFVAIVATLIRRSLAHRVATPNRFAGVRSALETGVTGTVVLRSLADPQAATLDVGRDVVTVRRGAAPNADVTITLDLDDPDAKPKVEGAARHPALAVLVGTLLDAPVRDWQTEADDFFAVAMADPDCPRPVRIVASDEGTERWFGLEGGSSDDAVAAVELHAPATVLAESLSGSKIFTEEVLAGRVLLVGDLRMLSVLTGHAIDHAMGVVRSRGAAR